MIIAVVALIVFSAWATAGLVYWVLEHDKQKERADSLADDLNSARVETRQILDLYEAEKRKAAKYLEAADHDAKAAAAWRQNWESQNDVMNSLCKRLSSLADIRDRAESLFVDLDDLCKPDTGPATTEGQNGGGVA